MTPPATQPATVNQHVAAAREHLRQAGISDAESELSARLLAVHVLGWTTERLLVDGREPAPPAFTARYDDAVARRAAHEPLAYITGHREFWGLSLIVSPGVLIPRPETELIVETALALFPERAAPLSVIDGCTGSGCIAVALAHERPAAAIVATDISQDALDVAVRNAAVHDVADRIRFVRTDLFAGVAGPVDLITCNPPYVGERSRPAVQPEVRDHEPPVAVFSGDDGLFVLRRLVGDAAALLRPGGYLLFEFGYGQDEEIEALVAAEPRVILVELRRDLQGIARTAVCARH